MRAAANGLVVLLIVLPILGGLAALGRRFFRGGKLVGPIVLGTLGLTLLAAVVLAAVLPSANGILVGNWRWLRVPGAVPLQVVIRWRADPLALLCVLAVCVPAALIVASAARDPLRSVDHRFFSATSFLVAAAQGFFLSDDFLQALIFWQFAALAAFLLVSGDGDDPRAASVARTMFLIGRAADVLFVLGVLLVWLGFRSLDFGVVFSESGLAWLLDRNPAMAELIVVCLFAGTVGRCAQFPVSHWPYHLAGRSAEINAVISAVLMPMGIALLLRCEPLLAAAPQTRVLIAALGTLTALLAAASALTQTGWSHIAASLSVSQWGWAVLAVGCWPSAGIAPAMLHLVGLTPTLALLYLAVADAPNGQAGRGDSETVDLPSSPRLTRWALLIALLSVAGLFPLTGFWTQTAILDAVWRAAELHGTLADSSPEPGPYQYEPQFAFHCIFWVMLAAVFLISVAAVRAYFLMRRADLSRMSMAAGEQTSRPVELLVLLLLVVGLGAVIGQPTGLLEKWLGTPRTAGGMDLFAAGSRLIVVLLGLVIGWMLYARPSSIPGQVAHRFGALHRLSRYRFYLDEFYRLFVALPLLAAAQVCGFVERHVMAPLIAGVPSQLSLLLVRLVRPLQNGVVQLYALAAVLATAVLLVVFLMIQG